MKDISGGQLAADALVERGVEFIYTLSGGHITPIYQYLEKYLKKKTDRVPERNSDTVKRAGNTGY